MQPNRRTAETLHFEGSEKVAAHSATRTHPYRAEKPADRIQRIIGTSHKLKNKITFCILDT